VGGNAGNAEAGAARLPGFAARPRQVGTARGCAGWQARQPGGGRWGVGKVVCVGECVGHEMAGRGRCMEGLNRDMK